MPENPLLEGAVDDLARVGGLKSKTLQNLNGRVVRLLEWKPSTSAGDRWRVEFINEPATDPMTLLPINLGKLEDGEAPVDIEPPKPPPAPAPVTPVTTTTTTALKPSLPMATAPKPKPLDMLEQYRARSAKLSDPLPKSVYDPTKPFVKAKLDLALLLKEATDKAASQTQLDDWIPLGERPFTFDEGDNWMTGCRFTSAAEALGEKDEVLDDWTSQLPGYRFSSQIASVSLVDPGAPYDFSSDKYIRENVGDDDDPPPLMEINTTPTSKRKAGPGMSPQGGFRKRSSQNYPSPWQHYGHLKAEFGSPASPKSRVPSAAPSRAASPHRIEEVPPPPPIMEDVD